jgi:hypothetical protein
MYIYPSYLPCKMTHTSQSSSYPNTNTFVLKYFTNSTLHPSFLLFTCLCLFFFSQTHPYLSIFIIPPYIHLFFFSLAFAQAFFLLTCLSSFENIFVLFFFSLALVGSRTYFFLCPSRSVVLFCEIFTQFPFFFSGPP